MSDAWKAFCKESWAEHDPNVREAWNGALDAAAKRLEEFMAFMDANVRPYMNDHGKQIHDAQNSNQKSCIEAIRQLKAPERSK